MIRMWWLTSLLLVISCGAVHVEPPKAAVAPAQIETAKSDTYTAVTHIAAYADDPLSAFEEPEIAAVEQDIAVIQDETDDAKFVDEARTLKRDWDALVGLDDLLQQEIAI